MLIINLKAKNMKKKLKKICRDRKYCLFLTFKKSGSQRRKFWHKKCTEYCGKLFLEKSWNNLFLLMYNVVKQ